MFLDPKVQHSPKALCSMVFGPNKKALEYESLEVRSSGVSGDLEPKRPEAQAICFAFGL